MYGGVPSVNNLTAIYNFQVMYYYGKIIVFINSLIIIYKT